MNRAGVERMNRALQEGGRERDIWRKNGEKYFFKTG
jgi:hypothetical protein